MLSNSLAPEQRCARGVSFSACSPTRSAHYLPLIGPSSPSLLAVACCFVQTPTNLPSDGLHISLWASPFSHSSGNLSVKVWLMQWYLRGGRVRAKRVNFFMRVANSPPLLKLPLSAAWCGFNWGERINVWCATDTPPLTHTHTHTWTHIQTHAVSRSTPPHSSLPSLLNGSWRVLQQPRTVNKPIFWSTIFKCPLLSAPLH